MVDLHSQYLRIKSEIDDAIRDVLETTAFIKGPQVKEFSEELSSYLGGAFVVTCGNGTDALQIAMMALELKPGDEVVLPAHTYVAPLEVIALLGLKPLFVDVEEGTFNLDIQQLRKRITTRTKAIIPVHLYGQCAEMELIGQLAREYDLFVIEDAAQALGADFQYMDGTRKKAGTVGTIGTTSFFPTKSLGCFGDGGALLTRDSSLAERLRMIANHGQTVKYNYELVGINSRLDTIQAAILKVKLRHLGEYIRKRNDVADYYDGTLGKIRQVRIPERVPYSSHVFHQYTLRVEKREELREHLRSKGIPSMIYYPVPLHLQPAYRHYDKWPGSYPVTERLSKTVISLPIHTEMTPKELDYITHSIAEFYHA